MSAARRIIDRIIDRIIARQAGVRRPAKPRLGRGVGRWVGGALVLAVTLAACGGDKGPRLPCPRLFTLTDASRQTKFVGQGHDLTDVEFEAAIHNPVMACRYKDGAVESIVTLNIAAARGPADDDRRVRVTYVVIISALDRQGLWREKFDVDFEFEGNQTRLVAIEEVEPRIPLAEGRTGADYEIYLGLRLTPEELEYNRENR